MSSPSFFQRLWKVREGGEALTLASALTSILIFAAILVFTIHEGSWMLLRPQYLLGARWQPEYNRYGLLPLLYGSLIVTAGALAISTPIGVASAIFISEVAPRWIGEVMRGAIETLAAIPSIIYGFIAYFFLAPWIAAVFHLSLGRTALTASLILSIMTLPTIISISSEAISSVPMAYREASLALGADRWQTLWRVVLPAARLGIFASILLAFGRAIGETIAVLMASGCVAAIPNPPWNLLSPVYPMTAAIAIGMGEAEFRGLHYHALYTLALILLCISALVNNIARLLIRKVPRGEVRI